VVTRFYPVDFVEDVGDGLNTLDAFSISDPLVLVNEPLLLRVDLEDHIPKNPDILGRVLEHPDVSAMEHCFHNFKGASGLT
jgi:hypothetical protein